MSVFTKHRRARQGYGMQLPGAEPPMSDPSVLISRAGQDLTAEFVEPGTVSTDGLTVQWTMKVADASEQRAGGSYTVLCKATDSNDERHTAHARLTVSNEGWVEPAA
jgi:hypothetical protein